MGNRMELRQLTYFVAVAEELKQTRDAMLALQSTQTASLAQTRENILERLHTTLAEQGKAEQELIQATMRHATLQLTTSMEALTKTVDGRLEQIGGKVSVNANGTGEARLSIPIHGSAGEGTAISHALRSGGKWDMRLIVVQVEGSASIVLLNKDKIPVPNASVGI